jgi:hypothetical protein
VNLDTDKSNPSSEVPDIMPKTTNSFAMLLSVILLNFNSLPDHPERPIFVFGNMEQFLQKE